MLAKVLKIIFSKNYNNNALYGINDKRDAREKKKKKKIERDLKPQKFI